LLFSLWSARKDVLSDDSVGAKEHLSSAEQFLRETEAETAAALDTYLMLQFVSRLSG
jgi:hypothetical protein